MKKIIISGSSGLTGSQVVKKLMRSRELKESKLILGNRKTNKEYENYVNLKQEVISDFSKREEWSRLIETHDPDVILNISNIRHSRALIDALRLSNSSPDLYVVGTTAVHSIHQRCNEEYRALEKIIKEYEGNYCIISSQ